MKKTILITALLVAALAVFGVGVVFAQDVTPPPVGRGPMMQNETQGPLHTYLVNELAAKLGLKAGEVEAKLAAGETMYEIALADGVTAENFPALMAEVRSAAYAAAVKDGVMTQEQADWMKTRGNRANGAGYDGNCPMQDGTYQNGAGFRGGPGGMMGRGQGGGMMGGWGAGYQQTNP